MSNTSVLTRIPENSSFLQPTKFLFTFTTLPFIRYFCQSVTIPGMSTSAVAVENPFSKNYRHGDKLEYETFNLTALLDEDMRLWEETYNWFRAITFPHEFLNYWKNNIEAPIKEVKISVSNTNQLINTDFYRVIN